jgi:hypothetical protein
MQCTVRGLWIHNTCTGTWDDMFTGISDNMFDFLDGQYNLTGMAYWAYRPCTTYAQKMNHRIKDIENKLEEAK